MKYTTPFLTAALAVALLAWEFWPVDASRARVAAKTPAYGWEEIHKILEESNKLETYWTTCRDFHATLTETRGKLAAGDTTLSESTDVILDAARWDNSEFLRHLRESIPAGRSDRECVALSLLNYLDRGIESSDYPPEKLARLEELRAEFASPQFQATCERGGEKISPSVQEEDEALP
jgi:hypothetical protein